MTKDSWLSEVLDELSENQSHDEGTGYFPKAKMTLAQAHKLISAQLIRERVEEVTELLTYGDLKRFPIETLQDRLADLTNQLKEL